MIKFKVKKNQLVDSTNMVTNVVNVKSIGLGKQTVLASNDVAITLTPSTMNLVLSNQVNSIYCEQIPIEVIEGEMSDHLDKSYKINAKKLSSIVKGSSKEVTFVISESTVAIGEGKRRFDLSFYVASRTDAPEIQLSENPIPIKTVVKNLNDSFLITSLSGKYEELSGTLFTNKGMVSSDRIAALYIRNGELFENAEDLVFSTDLFSTCLSKTKEKEAFIGMTTNKQKVVLKINNMTITKSLLSTKFPKDAIFNIFETIENKIGRTTASAKISIKDFSEKLMEIRDIVESDKYFVKFNPEGYVSLEDNNSLTGADGLVYVDAEVSRSDTIIGGKFFFTHLETLIKIFPEKEVTLFMSPLKEKADYAEWIGVKSDTRLFFFTALRAGA
jgi:hypothetical protein